MHHRCVQDALNIQNDFIYKAASGLAGGTGECIDGKCGGVSGGIIAMSTFFGRTREEQGTTKGREDKYVSFRMAQPYMTSLWKNTGQ